MEYQVTLFDKTNTYKPVTCLVKADKPITTVEQKKEIQKKGITKICNTRRWGTNDLRKYGYTVIKVREYDKAKIEKEKKERYEQIKEQHYADGSWVRPKNQTTGVDIQV